MRIVILSKAKDLLFAAAAVAMITACKGSKQPPVTAAASVADSADQVFFKMSSFLTTNGVQRGKITADTAYVLDDQTRFDMRNTHVDFTTEAGAPQGTMDAKKGVYSTRTQILEGWGDVLVKLVDGRSLKSPHVVYNSISHLITSDTNYTITGPQGTQYGIGFTSNQNFSSFRCARACGGNMLVAVPTK